MARKLYGPIVVATPTPDATDDNLIKFASVALSVYRTQTGTAETDLQTPAGTPITTVTPDGTTGAVSWQGPDGYTGMMWIGDAATGIRYPVVPSDIADRTSTITGITLAGGTTNTGPVVDIPSMDATEATTGTSTVPELIAPTTLKTAIQTHSRGNLWVMAVWDGTGTQPARPTLPAGTVVRFRQPTAPTGAVAGDEWLTT